MCLGVCSTAVLNTRAPRAAQAAVLFVCAKPDITQRAHSGLPCWFGGCGLPCCCVPAHLLKKLHRLRALCLAGAWIVCHRRSAHYSFCYFRSGGLWAIHPCCRNCHDSSQLPSHAAAAASAPQAACALTQPSLSLLNTVMLLFDNNEAGLEASPRAHSGLEKAGGTQVGEQADGFTSVTACCSRARLASAEERHRKYTHDNTVVAQPTAALRRKRQR